MPIAQMRICRALMLSGMLLVPAVQAAELRVGFSQDAQTMDPANHRNRENETIIRNMCDGLLTRDADMKVVPELAQSYRQIDDKTWEFKIRPGITFHSGGAMPSSWNAIPSITAVRRPYPRLGRPRSIG